MRNSSARGGVGMVVGCCGGSGLWITVVSPADPKNPWLRCMSRTKSLTPTKAATRPLTDLRRAVNIAQDAHWPAQFRSVRTIVERTQVRYQSWAVWTMGRSSEVAASQADTE